MYIGYISPEDEFEEDDQGYDFDEESDLSDCDTQDSEY